LQICFLVVLIPDSDLPNSQRALPLSSLGTPNNVVYLAVGLPRAKILDLDLPKVFVVTIADIQGGSIELL